MKQYTIMAANKRKTNRHYGRPRSQGRRAGIHAEKMTPSPSLTNTWGPFLEIPEKPLVKLRPTYSVKLVFSYVVKGIKIKITAKFRASKRLRFEDTNRI